MIHDFAELVREHQAMVWSCAWHCLHDGTLAEEVAQEVFLSLHSRLNSFDSPAHIRHWLRRTAVHRSIDEARKRRLRLHVPLEDLGDPAAPAAASDPMLAGALRRLVASLPEKARMVVVLRYQEDLDPMEIAETLDLPVRTVKSRLQRSLALMRAKLARQANGVQI